jgi:hypothetical protein
VFVAVLAVIAILGGLHQGFGNVWPWMVILVVDIAVKAGLLPGSFSVGRDGGGC